MTAPGFQSGFQRDRTEPVQRAIGEKKKPAYASSFTYAPKRTRTSTRLSRTRPSTWRVYQFRHRREGGEYSPDPRACARPRAEVPCANTRSRPSEEAPAHGDRKGPDE